VGLWSTGWISARYIVGVSEPLTFLAARFAFGTAALGLLALAMGATWPRRPRDYAHMFVAGALIQALYLGGVWWAVAHGVPAGLSGLIAALQPILTALLAPVFFAERISARQWGGIVLSVAGLVLVLGPKLTGIDVTQLRGVLVPVAVNVGAMVAVTLGTIYQKKYVPGSDLIVTTAVQNFAGVLLTVPLALLAGETLSVVWTPVTMAVMAWSVVGISIGANLLFFWLIRHGAMSRAASLIYLVPPAVALEAFLLFGERLAAPQLAGMALTVVGVALAVKR
jgi:drug/metabolite transporter (DMT)-like permease